MAVVRDTPYGAFNFTVELNDGGKSKLGRDHNHYGFTVWMAGGGIRGGTVHGATDEFGFRAVEQRTTVHDLHAHFYASTARTTLPSTSVSRKSRPAWR